jgi:hypothetical protein
MGASLERMSSGSGRFWIGLKMPARKNCGSITNGKIWFAARWLDRFARTITPNAPPKSAMTTIASAMRTSCSGLMWICRMNPNAMMASACGSATRDSPSIFPRMIE